MRRELQFAFGTMSFLAGLLLGATSSAAAEPKAPLAEAYLVSGNLAEGEAALTKRLLDQADDEEARFGLGVVQLTRSVERLVQSLHQHGLRDRGNQLPFLRLAVPENPNPEKLSYATARKILQTFASDLKVSEATLAGIRGKDFMLRLHVGRVRLDLNGDGQATAEETLWKLFTDINRGVAVPDEIVAQFYVAFDRADVTWLRGYCHVLMGLCETLLAHDGKELFERTAHIFFPQVESPHTFLENPRPLFQFGHIDVIDIIAFIHLINLPVVEPARMKTALAHFETVIELSRQNWREIQAEVDNEQEWVPNPKQTGVLPGIRVTPEMIAGWHDFLNEAELILAGKKLIPFWRSNDGRGVNLRRVFTEPRTFDLVMWVQGTGVTPYLEEGSVTQPETWNRINRLFNGSFLGFAAWFN